MCEYMYDILWYTAISDRLFNNFMTWFSFPFFILIFFYYECKVIQVGLNNINFSNLKLRCIYFYLNILRARSLLKFIFDNWFRTNNKIVLFICYIRIQRTDFTKFRDFFEKIFFCATFDIVAYLTLYFQHEQLILFSMQYSFCERKIIKL